MIPLIRPSLPPDVVAAGYLKSARDQRQLSNFGPCHEQLIDRLVEIMGGHVALASSGTAALELALRSLRLKPGARVLLPDFTHTGTLIAVVRAGLTPVLAAVNANSWRLDPPPAAAQVAAVIVVEPFGYGADFAAWADLPVPVVFDCAGGWRYGKVKAPGPVCYSFHATKNLGVGEGGMVWFPPGDADRAAETRRLSNFDTLPDRSIASLGGGNLKLDELRCAYLLAATEPEWLSKVEARAMAKRATIRLYETMLGCPLPAPMFRGAWPSLCVLGYLPAAALEASKRGAVFRHYYPLLSRMPALDGVERISVSSDAMASCCALPSDVDIHEAAQVVKIVREFF